MMISQELANHIVKQTLKIMVFAALSGALFGIALSGLVIWWMS